MKILLVTESYWPNADGGALFERRLVLGLVERGYQVTVWAAGSKPVSYLQEDGPYTIFREKAVRFIFNKKYKVSYFPLFSGRTVIRRFRPDVVHIHNFGLMGLSSLFWAKRYGIPIVATNHFMPENALLNIRTLRPFSRFLNPLIWRYLVGLHNLCDVVTSPTDTAVSLLKLHGLTAPSETITNGIDTTVFRAGIDTSAVRKKYRLPDGAKILLYLGRLDGEKRLDVLIAAMPRVNSQAQLILAGTGITQLNLEDQAQKLGVADRITFAGYIDEVDKPAVYNVASLFVISSPAELQSIVLLEAMATGLPLVAVDVAALSELCRNNENGLLFPRDDSEALASCVNTILNKPELAKAFGLRSRHIVEEAHSSQYMINRFSTVYDRLGTKHADKVRHLAN